MKIELILVFAAFLCCNCAPTTVAPGTDATRISPEHLKDILEARVAKLDQRVKDEILKLMNGGRSHLAHNLLDESKRVDELAQELKNTTNELALKLLDGELARAEFRLEEELRALEMQPKVKADLISDTNRLRLWIAEEEINLKKQGGHDAKKAAERLKDEDGKLKDLVKDLIKEDKDKDLAEIESKLRALEVRVVEELIRLGYQLPTSEPITGAPITERPATTGAPTTERPATTGAPTTERPATTGAPTTVPVTANSSAASRATTGAARTTSK